MDESSSGPTAGELSNETEAKSSAELIDTPKEVRLRSPVAMVREEIERFPEEKKAAYEKALRDFPKLVERETPESRFVAAEDGDIHRAAIRLASYWTNRVDIFGDRAYLPLDQTGEGALDPAVLELLDTGAIVCLPKDKSGRVVMGFDRTRFEKKHFESSYDDAVVKYGFYMLAIASESLSAQSSGVVLVATLSRPVRRDVHHRVAAIIRDCLPIRKVETHVIFPPSSLTFIGRITWVILDIYHMALESLMCSAPKVHHGNTDEETLASVAACGVYVEGLPEWMGGTWGMSDLQEWRTRRVDIEQQRTRNREQKKRLKREGDAARARERRRTRRLEKDMLQDQIRAMVNENEAIANEGQRLELLLAYAKNQVTHMETQWTYPESPTLPVENDWTCFRGFYADAEPTPLPIRGSYAM